MLARTGAPPAPRRSRPAAIEPLHDARDRQPRIPVLPVRGAAVVRDKF